MPQATTPNLNSGSVLSLKSNLRLRMVLERVSGLLERLNWLPRSTKTQAEAIVIKKPQQSLKAWGDQKWRTKSGKKSSETGERYLPESAIKSLSPAEYASTTKAKREGKAAGKQFVAQPKKIAQKTAKYRF
jgi:hypothetical protein